MPGYLHNAKPVSQRREDFGGECTVAAHTRKTITKMLERKADAASSAASGELCRV
jgi:hypothetical protein